MNNESTDVVGETFDDAASFMNLNTQMVTSDESHRRYEKSKVTEHIEFTGFALDSAPNASV